MTPTGSTPMDQAETGLSTFLSVAIVGLAAILLYEPDRPAPRPLASFHAAPTPAPASKAPPIARAEVLPPATHAPSPATTRPAPTLTPPAPVVIVVDEPRPATTIRQVSRSTATARVRAAFARVVAGESLADVARRVYGPDADPRALWLSNRDQLASADAPLAEGMRLRTPWP